MDVFEHVFSLFDSLGKIIMPYSFVSLLVVRLLVHVWRKNNYYYVIHLLKFIWYLLQGTLLLAGDVYIETVVIYICFFEAWDFLLNYYAERPQKPKKVYTQSGKSL